MKKKQITYLTYRSKNGHNTTYKFSRPATTRILNEQTTISVYWTEFLLTKVRAKIDQQRIDWIITLHHI